MFVPVGDGFMIIALVGFHPTLYYSSPLETRNGLLGEYFRHRLKLPYGSKVTKLDLLNYGRTDVAFCKIDDETFEMDFSV